MVCQRDLLYGVVLARELQGGFHVYNMTTVAEVRETGLEISFLKLYVSSLSPSQPLSLSG